MNDSNLSKTNFEPTQATVLTRSQSQKLAGWQSPTMLSPSEIESLRQQAKRANVEIRLYLDSLLSTKEE